jgi:hypothetical protein
MAQVAELRFLALALAIEASVKAMTFETAIRQPASVVIEAKMRRPGSQSWMSSIQS